MRNRVTLKQIAEATGLHFTTVSMALRDDHRIRAATRARVAAAAQKLGYVPDPMLKALSVYRTAKRPPAFHATLGWINSNPQRVNPLAQVTTEYLQGARERAQQLGYSVEDFWTLDPALRDERLVRVLRYRNISGLLIAPQPQSRASLALPWDQFSAVTFGYSLIEPQLHSVSNHQYRTIRRVLREVRSLGYRRVGLWLFEEHDRRVNDNWSAGFWVDFHQLRKTERVEPFVFADASKADDEEFTRWLRRARPDVVVTGDARVPRWLRACGWRVPVDIGLAMLSVNREDTTTSGTYENNLVIGAAAVDLLVGMMHRHERGVPAVAQWHLVESEWRPGTTLRGRE